MTILIYQDYIHNHGQLFQALRPFGLVDFCDAGQIIHGGILNRDIRLLVMPGGADLYYCEKLNGAGNKAIRSYVDNGGSYLGICAGAYYGCGGLSWAAGSVQEISGPRELAFYNGIATGPIDILMQGLDKSWHGAAPLIDRNGHQTTISYEAGPFFSEPENNEQSVVARYASLPGQPPAIVAGRFGKGKFTLSGPHIERLAGNILYQNNNPWHDHDRTVFETLESASMGREHLWQNIMRYLIDDA